MNRDNLLSQAGQLPGGEPRGGVVNPLLDTSVKNMSGIEFFGSAIRTIIGALLVLAAVLFFFYFIMGGISWITSGGDKGQIESARQKVIQAVVGILVVFSVFAVAKLIETLFGISILEIPINSLSIS